MRKMLWVALVLCLCLPMIGGGCTEEQEDQVVTVSEGAGNMAKTAAPFLPPPFNLIALAVAGVAEGATAWIAYRRKKRAVTAEAKAAHAEQMKLRLNEGAQVFGDMIDTLREDPDHKAKVEAVLELVDSYKRTANAYTKQAFGWFDAARERMG